MEYCFWCGPPIQEGHEETEEAYQVEGYQGGKHTTYKEAAESWLI